MKGKFIVIEGGEGAGKDTQIDLFRKKFGEEDFVYVKDPGSTDIGLKLRELLLYNKDVSRTTELLLYLAARVQLVDEKITPALEAGQHVISNRFDISTLAYQIHGREREDLTDFVKQMSEFAISATKPDLVIFLDCDPKVGLSRTVHREERDSKFEAEALAFHERVREGYKKHLGEYNHVIIDSTNSIEDVHQEVRKAIKTEIA